MCICVIYKTYFLPIGLSQKHENHWLSDPLGRLRSLRRDVRTGRRALNLCSSSSLCLQLSLPASPLFKNLPQSPRAAMSFPPWNPSSVLLSSCHLVCLFFVALITLPYIMIICIQQYGFYPPYKLSSSNVVCIISLP